MVSGNLQQSGMNYSYLDYIKLLARTEEFNYNLGVLVIYAAYLLPDVIFFF